MPQIDPTTGKPFATGYNPLDTSRTLTKKGGDIVQQDYLASQRNADAKATTPLPISTADNAHLYDNTPAGDVYSGLVPEQGDQSAYKTYEDILKEQTQPVNEADIRSQTMERYQAEIDALNRVYEEKKAAERIAGEGRLGSSGAIQARRRLLGSDFGASQTATITDFNQKVQDAISAENSAKIANIMSIARGEAKTEFDSKVAARKTGAQDYIDFLSGQTERKNKRVNSTIANMLLNSVEADDDILSQLSKELGVSVDVLKAEYNTQKKDAVPEPVDPIEVDGALVDPTTGEVIYQAEAGSDWKYQRGTSSQPAGWTNTKGEFKPLSAGNPNSTTPVGTEEEDEEGESDLDYATRTIEFYSDEKATDIMELLKRDTDLTSQELKILIKEKRG